MPLAHKTDYVAECLDLNLEQYKGKPRLEAMLTSFALELQAVEDALWDVWINRQLQDGVATGDLLAKLGKLVGQTSLGLADDKFLILITARIRANRSDGRRGDMIAIAGLLVPETTIAAHDYPPAAFRLEPHGPVPLDPYIIADSFLSPAIAAGVRLMFVWTIAPWAQTIIGGSIYATDFDAGPPATSTGVGAGQVPGSIYYGSFDPGPPVTGDGGGYTSGVIQSGA